MPDDEAPGEPATASESAISRFAAQLRQLRLDAGSPSFRYLAKVTHFSSSTLAEATAGRRLPTEQVVKAFVEACGADPAQWLALQREVARTEGTSDGAIALPTEPEPEPDPHDGSDRGRRGSLVVLASCCLVAGLLLGAAAVGLTPVVAREPRGTPSPVFTGTVGPAPTTAHAADGDDPVAAHCAGDAVLVDKAAVMLSNVQVGALELKYSSFCGAGWARIYLYPGQPTMLGLVEVSSSDGRSASFEDPLVKQVSVYTNVIVPGDGRCLSARATFYATGAAPVSASIPCQATTGK